MSSTNKQDIVTPKQIVEAKKAKEPVKPEKPHHTGKGTRARLNTAAEKMFYQSKFSK